MTENELVKLAHFALSMIVYFCVGACIHMITPEHKRIAAGSLILSGMLMCAVFIWSGAVQCHDNLRIDALEKQVAQLQKDLTNEQE